MYKKTSPTLVKISLFFGLLILAATIKGQAVKGKVLVMGKVDTVKSKILNETRRISVYVPYNGAGHAYGTARYPVIYLLDSDDHFPSVTGIVQQLSEINFNMVCPDMIVVGISNLNRTRDLTPTKTAFDSTSGGGEKFLSFIEKELMPHIDSIYPTAPYKIFIGHSLGGLTVINTLINHPDLFNGFVAIDPSMWWDNQKLLNQAREVLKQKNYADKSLYLGIANTMHADMDTIKVRKDTTKGTRHIRSILLLKDMLQSDKQINKINFDYKYYATDSHGTVPMIATYDALHFLFKLYPMPRELHDRLNTEKPDTAVIKEALQYYDNVSKQMGYRVDPPLGAIANLGFPFLEKQPTLALKIFSMGVSLYPDNPWAYFLMGEYYKTKKDKAKAIENLTKSLSIQEYGEIRDELNTLLAEK